VPEKALNGFFAGWQCRLIALGFCPVLERKELVHNSEQSQGTKAAHSMQLIARTKVRRNAMLTNCRNCNVNELPEKAVQQQNFLSQLSLPSSNFLKISVAEKIQLSMMPATVNVPPTIAQTVVRKW